MAAQEIVLVTGANTGLGFEIIKAFCGSDKSYNIILGGRSIEKVQKAVETAKQEFPSSHSTLSPLQVDIESDESIQKAFEEVQTKSGRVDALINNAGTQLDPQLTTGRLPMRQIWNQSWNVNVTGTQILTFTFIPLLLRSSNPRLLFITSGTSTLAGTENMAIAVNHIPPKGWPKQSLGLAAYRSSKTGMNMMMREWYRILKGDGVKVWCVSPGMLATGLGGGGAQALKEMGAADPATGAAFVRRVVEGERDKDVGLVVSSGGVQPW
ncbi:MAG: hypothetical protein Q9160_004233 [Pyrenula sp. 1 TL-2023]